MPIGSPGMEGPNPTPYDVLSFEKDGRIQVYERVHPLQIVRFTVFASFSVNRRVCGTWTCAAIADDAPCCLQEGGLTGASLPQPPR